MRSRAGSGRSQSTDDVREGGERFVDVDRLLETVLVLAGSGWSQTLGSSKIDEVEDALDEVKVMREFKGGGRRGARFGM
jgi:hypothetical protein